MGSDKYNAGKLEKLYDLYGKWTYGIIVNLTGNEQVAEELFQTLWVKIVENQDIIPDPPKTARTKNYIRVMAKNLVRDTAKKEVKSNILYVEDLTYELSSDNEIEKEIFDIDDRGKLMEAVTYLREEEQELIYLHYCEELSYRDIAQMVGKQETALRMQVSRAKKRLKEIVVELERKEAE